MDATLTCEQCGIETETRQLVEDGRYLCLPCIEDNPGPVGSDHDKAEATPEQIAEWKAQLPDDLRFGEFERDFLIERKHYRYGAWNTAGDWWLAWNTDEEFQQQLSTMENNDN